MKPSIENKQAEHALRQQAALLDLSGEAIMAWELESGAITFWNRGAKALYGYSREEAVGRVPWELLRTSARICFCASQMSLLLWTEPLAICDMYLLLAVELIGIRLSNSEIAAITTRFNMNTAILAAVLRTGEARESSSNGHTSGGYYRFLSGIANRDQNAH
jgi:sensor histidine kinase regulating citrate/malate metabolism